MSDLKTLRTSIRLLEGPVYAVLDGAQFENLPEALTGAGILARSLYLDRGDNHPERLITAPHVIGPLEGATLDAVLRMLEAAHPAAAVFWECGDGGEVLFRHLRGINMVLVPPDTNVEGPPSYAGPAVADDLDVGSSTQMLVLFRHADANVIGQVLPTLDALQRRRFFGPASTVIALPAPLWNGDASGLCVEREKGGETRPSGPLRLDRRNIAEIMHGRWSGLERKVAEQLRRIAPERTGMLEEDSFRDFVQGSLEQSRQLGIQTDGGHFRWAYMSLVTRGRLGDNPSVKAAMSADAPGYSADMRVAMLMRYAIASMKNDVGPAGDS